MLSLRHAQLVATVGAVTLLAGGGCADAAWHRGAWVKAGVESEQQRRDQDECERYALTSAERPAALYAECMRTRGYEPARFDRPVRPHPERGATRD
jgi:hypothetical protein